MLLRTLSILLVLVLLAFISTGWIAFAVFGLFLGLISRIVLRWFREPGKKTRRITIVSLVLLVVLLLVSISLPTGVTEGPRDVVISVCYNAIFSPGSDTTAWEIQEEFLLDKDCLPSFGIPADFEGQTDNDSAIQTGPHEELIEKLLLTGWEQTGQVDGSDQFIRTRYHSPAAVWYQITTANEIPIEIGIIETSTHRIRFFPDSKSRVIIDVPKYLVASTFPPYSQRADQLGNNERLIVPLDFLRLEELRLAVAILNPMLRWPLGAMIGTFSLWSAFRWIILALWAVFFDQFKEKILKPVFSRILSKKKKETESKEKKEVGSKEKKKTECEENTNESSNKNSIKE